MADAKIVIGAVDNTSAVLASVRTSLDGVRASASSLAPVLASLGVGLSVGAVTAFVRNIANGLNALKDLKDATGASIENISALEDIAARTGTSFDTVGTSLVKFNAALSAAKPGSDAEAAFKALGLSVTELKSIDPAEALRKTAVALSGFADDGNKARLVQELFGKSLREVAPFLADLAAAGKLNAKVTTEQAEAAERFNDQLSKSAKNTLDLARFLTNDLITAINASAETFRNSGLLAGLGVLFGGNEQYRQDKEFVELVGKKIELETELGKLRQRGFNDDSRGVRANQVELDGVNAQIKALQRLRDVTNPDNVGSETIRANRKRSVNFDGAPKKESADRQSEAERYLETLQKQLEKTQDLTFIEQLLTDIEKGRIDGITPKLKAQLEATAHLLDAAYFKTKADKEALQLAKEEADARVRADEQVTKYITSLVAQNDKSAEHNEILRNELQEMGLSTAALDTLRLARLDANIAQEQENLLLAQSIEKNDEEIKQIERRIALKQIERGLVDVTAKKRVQVEEQDENKKRTEALSKSIEDGILNGFRNGKGFADVFLEELKAQFAKTVLRPIIQPFAQAASDTLGSFLTKLLSFDGGGYTGDGARSGGLDGKGGFLSLVHPQESIIDHSKGQSGSGTTVHVTINQPVGDIATVSMLQKSNAALLRQIQASIGRNTRYGGGLG